MEWEFETGDRADVVLKDRFDRFVAVEVEVDCDASERIGPLQCMKYRAMLSYYFDRPLEEVRCILAAHSIHSGVAQRCAQHAIQTSAVPRVTSFMIGIRNSAPPFEMCCGQTEANHWHFRRGVRI
jgi:hypothetical protein